LSNITYYEADGETLDYIEQYNIHGSNVVYKEQYAIGSDTLSNITYYEADGETLDYIEQYNIHGSNVVYKEQYAIGSDTLSNVTYYEAYGETLDYIEQYNIHGTNIVYKEQYAIGSDTLSNVTFYKEDGVTIVTLDQYDVYGSNITFTEKYNSGILNYITFLENDGKTVSSVSLYDTDGVTVKTITQYSNGIIDTVRYYDSASITFVDIYTYTTTQELPFTLNFITKYIGSTTNVSEISYYNPSKILIYKAVYNGNTSVEYYIYYDASGTYKVRTELYGDDGITIKSKTYYTNSGSTVNRIVTYTSSGKELNYYPALSNGWHYILYNTYDYYLRDLGNNEFNFKYHWHSIDFGESASSPAVVEMKYRNSEFVENYFKLNGNNDIIAHRFGLVREGTKDFTAEQCPVINNVIKVQNATWFVSFFFRKVSTSEDKRLFVLNFNQDWVNRIRAYSNKNGLVKIRVDLSDSTKWLEHKYALMQNNNHFFMTYNHQSTERSKIRLYVNGAYAGYVAFTREGNNSNTKVNEFRVGLSGNYNRLNDVLIGRYTPTNPHKDDAIRKTILNIPYTRTYSQALSIMNSK
jgi:hypothetical protein